ncbi:MAG: glycoside hydrolase family 3 C-terminal domain-containing protein, partial [Candidatus Thorarchaeota archaeon]
YGGSSAVIPPYEITPFRGIKEICGDKAEIVNDPSKADCAIVFAGLNHSRGMDSESRDRSTLHLPETQVDQIIRTAEENPNTIVVLISGSPVVMDNWMENVPAILEAWYAGMQGGQAIANVLFGKVNPSGKLPITFPRRLEDSPPHSSGDCRTYPGDELKRVYYDEGIFVGYRWFEHRMVVPLFPFGYGLSYTDFELENLCLEKESVAASSESVSLSIDVTNTGEYEGFETVQVYSHDIASTVERPPKELVGFEKVWLNPGETKEASIGIRIADLAFYDVISADWLVEKGDFELLVGPSSNDIKCKTTFTYG